MTLPLLSGDRTVAEATVKPAQKANGPNDSTTEFISQGDHDPGDDPMQQLTLPLDPSARTARARFLCGFSGRLEHSL
ncbi:MAG: hypothetical protein E5V37_06655 [Mesorhizobium sp.]|nr:MAG: hypothetical protein E5V53_01340 [Mesorhizobium sp.]TIX32823.1 MAG: hypothetical protein E5V37_06655 [Mesorhizobium sp.]